MNEAGRRQYPPGDTSYTQSDPVGNGHAFLAAHLTGRAKGRSPFSADCRSSNRVLPHLRSRSSHSRPCCTNDWEQNPQIIICVKALRAF